MLAVIAPSTSRHGASLRKLSPHIYPTRWRSGGGDRPPLLRFWDFMRLQSNGFPDFGGQNAWYCSSRAGSGRDGEDPEGSEGVPEGPQDAVPADPVGNGANDKGSAGSSGGAGGENGGGGGDGGRGRGRRPGLIQRLLKGSGGEKGGKGAEENATAAEVEGKEGESVAAAEDAAPTTSAIVPAGPRAENFPRVLAVPVTRRPLFPGFYTPVNIRDPKLAEALTELRARGTPYVGVFLLKNSDQVTKELRENEAHDKGLPAEQDGHDGDTFTGKALYKQLHEYGTFAQVLNVIKTVDGDGLGQVILMGHRRLRLTGMVTEDPLTVSVEHVKDKPYDETADIMKATFLEVVGTLKDLIRFNPLYKESIQVFVQNTGNFNAARVADFGAAITTADDSVLQEVLEQTDVEKRLGLTLMLLKKELEIARLQASIAKTVEEKISGEQRRFFLMEQLKAIKKELGLETDDKTALTAKFRERLAARKQGCPTHVLQVIEEELAKLQALEPSSSEFNVTRNYLDWLTSLPWGQYSEENYDVKQAQKILDEEHYGLADIKERILEFIAVGKLRGTALGKIICLAGPPGVGKTSIGRSIAHALNRKFYRFSVGGLGDVAEIKGHRRTYVGAMPGKMVQCLKTTGTANPLVLIDEIDKLGRGNTGDPASALLELLDPEQNANFLDHYLDVPIDLSKVLFVCTANLVETIPSPLLDRMEVIRLVGYISDEKMHIARDYLVRAALESSGVKPEQVQISDGALHTLIETYCREAGVRNLQKHIEKIYRKVALKLVRSELLEAGKGEGQLASTDVSGNFHPNQVEPVVIIDKQEKESEVNNELLPKPEEPASAAETKEPSMSSKEVNKPKIVIDETSLYEYVGNPIFQSDRLYDETPIGVVMGLAWTAMGGSTLYIETSLIDQGDGKGALQLTGQLGDVMKESATIAHTVSRAILREKDPDNMFFLNSRLHLHVPAGATPKDGPSAGCTMITSLLSLAMKKPVKKDIAMTGEVTLTGRILPIGGVKEKTVAARRSGVKVIIFPMANKRDFDELLPHVKEGLDVHFVEKYDEIFQLAFDQDQVTSTANVVFT
ncbi:hypothetical protein O6H91_03G071600 [Diphasiastrum complanatum]|uniref:Uncharacterized protein n=1 Tax=Diphasiastrum complanatum TaxID=34168 RepID=A0ACC2E7P4_DIPCM|nr:hypothetical protein O6H91_03G071600 [Diphasiastrum complanatum]